MNETAAILTLALCTVHKDLGYEYNEILSIYKHFFNDVKAIEKERELKLLEKKEYQTALGLDDACMDLLKNIMKRY